MSDPKNMRQLATDIIPSPTVLKLISNFRGWGIPPAISCRLGNCEVIMTAQHVLKCLLRYSLYKAHEQRSSAQSVQWLRG